MRKLILALALLGACSSPPTGPPACSTGQSSNGDRSTLKLVTEGDRVTGTYDVTPAGESVAVRYQIEGQAKDGRLNTTWVVGSMVLQVTGRYTAVEIVLDDPKGEFGTTRFVAGC